MLRGYPPVGQSSLMDRGDRLSALCSFDKHGFVAWEYTPGTFNRERFLTAAESVVVRATALHWRCRSLRRSLTARACNAAGPGQRVPGPTLGGAHRQRVDPQDDGLCESGAALFAQSILARGAPCGGASHVARAPHDRSISAAESSCSRRPTAGISPRSTTARSAPSSASSSRE
jgi:hypothetical protein